VSLKKHCYWSNNCMQR